MRVYEGDYVFERGITKNDFRAAESNVLPLCPSRKLFKNGGFFIPI
jgi:hypothetical protein